MKTITSKRCPACGRNLALSAFSRDAQPRSGLACYCRECASAYSRAYQQRPEVAARRQQAGKRRYEANKELHSQRMRQYHARPEVKARRKKQRRAYYLANRERQLAQSKAYAKTPAGKAAARKGSAKWEASPKGRRWRERWHQQRPARRLAIEAVRQAMRSGKAKRPMACDECGKQCKPQAHHHLGYAKEHWLAVRWLCPVCHRAADAA